MDTFKVVSKNRKTLDRTIGILLILMSIAIGVFLVPGLWALIGKFTKLITYEPGDLFSFRYSSFTQFVGWILAYVIFRTGIGFYRDSKKPT
ncbi:hypothetical protein [Flagellimonas algicola]|uniref:Solute:sodium symporter small subunit n=1 Tax=Flagellimonas algicola TaxID=2583815 RepID=A0ABY2WJM0_9FLAO|nr:hypothetical protein [Allomuricauda algicola]TMU54742.1 hypothetical protein FGG15_11110 [Allomuricauda algicola]